MPALLSLPAMKYTQQRKEKKILITQCFLLLYDRPMKMSCL